jgi:WS/DGAT/MGAT family acyltransferase
MADPLSPGDRSSLSAERGPVSMAVAGVLVFDGGPGVRRDAIAARIADRIHLVPRLRQRLEAPPLGLANPVWVDDHDFDIDWHVRDATLPEPGGDEDLSRLVGREMSRRLDRSRPLWELTVVDGLRLGRVAVVMKIHHALVDGMAALALAAVLLDPTPEPLEIPPPDSPWQPRPYALRNHLTKVAAKSVARAQKLMVNTAVRALDPDPRRAAGEVWRATEMLTELALNRPTPAPMTPLNRPISANRDFAFARADLTAVKALAKQSGGTVNDTILALVAGMLGRYLADAAPGAWNGRPPVALVPVSVRKADEHGELGNRFSTVLVELPTGAGELGDRVAAIARQTRQLKDSATVRAGAFVVGATGVAPPVVSAMLASAMGSVLVFNVVVSNLPGPQQPFYLNRCRLREVYPVVPLNPANQGLAIGMLSYDGEVFIGLNADRRLDPPLASASTALQSELDLVLGPQEPERTLRRPAWMPGQRSI